MERIAEYERELDRYAVETLAAIDGVRVLAGSAAERVPVVSFTLEGVAAQKAAEHATNFLLNRQAQVGHLNAILGRKPLIVSPYDAELFGHWWFEGPQFLNYLIRKAHFDQFMQGSGWLEVGEQRFEFAGHGARDKSWGPRYWQSIDWYRWIHCYVSPELSIRTLRS